MNNCLNILQRGWSLIARDRTPVTNRESKHLAIFAMSNVLFKVYFKLNNFQLCGKLISTVEGSGTMDVSAHLRCYPVCDVVMYKYYVGRIKMFEDRYDEARECLQFALRYCPRQLLRNRQRILASLVPVELCLGVLPSAAIAEKYSLQEFYDLGVAIKTGNVKHFEEIMQANQRVFIRLGVYLVLEQAKMIAYRSLFKRIAKIADNTKINLLYFQAALKWIGEEMDLDEIECILANLIYKNQVKGYISHQRRFLIVGKVDPFPAGAVIKKMKTH